MCRARKGVWGVGNKMTMSPKFHCCPVTQTLLLTLALSALLELEISCWDGRIQRFKGVLPRFERKIQPTFFLELVKKFKKVYKKPKKLKKKNVQKSFLEIPVVGKISTTLKAGQNTLKPVNIKKIKP